MKRKYTRRDFLFTGSLAVAGGMSMLYGCDPRRQLEGLKIGVIDINNDYGGLAKTAEIEAVEKAARIGFEGVEVTFGGTDGDGLLLLANEERQQRYLAEFERHGIEAAGTHLFILHENYLKDPDDPLARRWVEQAIPATSNLNTEVVLLPFFGDGALETEDEMNYVADLVGELGAKAEQYGVVLGLETTLSAEDNMRILERADSPAVQVYYDVGNSHQFGYNIYEEIRWLGSEHICQFHLKDNPHYMGEGDIDFPEVLWAIDEIGFKGWANLETLPVDGTRVEDLERNLGFIRDLKTEV